MNDQNIPTFVGNSAPKYLQIACTANWAPILWMRFCLRAYSRKEIDYSLLCKGHFQSARAGSTFFLLLTVSSISESSSTLRSCMGGRPGPLGVAPLCD